MSARLTIYRPSPTTVRFTVSDAPVRTTITARAIFFLGLILRVLIFLSVVFVNIAKARYHIGCLRENGSLFPLEDVWLKTALGVGVANFADRHSWLLIAAASMVIIHLVIRKYYTEESILVIRSLGIQTSTSSPTYFCSDSTRFIPTTQIQDIIIHEAFKGFEVRFYLALIVEGESEVVVVFPNLLPHRPILEQVWRGARKCLYDLKS